MQVWARVMCAPNLYAPLGALGSNAGQDPWEEWNGKDSPFRPSVVGRSIEICPPFLPRVSVNIILRLSVSLHKYDDVC